MLACAAVWRERTGVDVAWEFRSLRAFGDDPLEQLAEEYDLLVIDHPFCGLAARSACLAPLDELLESAVLDALAEDAVGPSHDSYSCLGRQWALAVDAACQVSALRSDRVPLDALVSWSAIVALARERPGRVAVPLAPAHAISSFLTLSANLGGRVATQAGLVEREVGERALEVLSELAALGPREAIDWEPPDVLGRLTQEDGEIECVPLTYGYVTYSRSDSVERPCAFVDLPLADEGPAGAVLGGAGLAVSAASPNTREAASFAAWVAGEEAQREIVLPAGGQPSSRAAWAEGDADRRSHGFFTGTVATMERAWVRPRTVWWPAFQLEAGRLLSRALAARSSVGRTLDQLEALYRDARSFA
jgi:multiple sugar transport system substrate-binding protein